MAVPARYLQQAVEVGKEHRMIDRKREWDMTKMTWTVEIIQPTCAAKVLPVTWPQSWVVQPSHVRVQQAIESVRVGDGFSADALYLCTRVAQELHGRQANGGREARVKAPRVRHVTALRLTE